MAKIARPTYEFSWYTPSEIKAKLDAGGDLEKEVRKEYTRLRDISQKRLKRLAAAGYTDTEAYKRNVNHYPKLKDIKSKSELAQRLSDLSRFVASSQSTVSGIKKREQKVLETLGEHNYDFVNEGNLKAFGDFMEEYRDQLLDMEYDSGDAADLYRIVEKNKIDPADIKEKFETYLNDLEATEDLFNIAKRHRLPIAEVMKDADFYLANIDIVRSLKVTKASMGNIDKFKKRIEKQLKKREKVNLSGNITYHQGNSVSSN